MSTQDNSTVNSEEMDFLRAQGIDPSRKDQIQILRPDWDIPGVDAGFTLRTGGVSKPPYDSLNLAMHVGDDPDDVRENRRRLVEHAGLPEEPRWLKQVHGNRVVHASEVERDVTEADAVWTDQPGQVCAVMVADCVPILLAAKDGSCVAAIHAGWRGLAAGVIEETVEAMPVPGEDLVAAIGPCISAKHYEVGEEVVESFRVKKILPMFSGLEKKRKGRVHLDLFGTAIQKLGLLQVMAANTTPCSYSGPKSWYSCRRGAKSGRFIGKIELLPVLEK